MLSILIPVYNFPIKQLVNDLIKQIRAGQLIAEIVIVNDASSEFNKENRESEKYDQVRYYELSNNRGRSFVRNLLAEKARYEFLLFMDCDAKIVDENFLKHYYQCIVDKKDVVCGGVEYAEKDNINREHYLRWYYGIKREKRPLDKRKEYPYRSFSSFNFMIKKDIFLNIKFPEQINTYGHEDTFFGLALQESGITITHVSNPLIHIGLEDSNSFIEKVKKSVQNLDKLTALVSNENILAREIKIFHYIRFVKKFHLKWIIKFIYSLSNTFIIRNLTSDNPSLRLFDFYKLGYYFYLKK